MFISEAPTDYGYDLFDFSETYGEVYYSNVFRNISNQLIPYEIDINGRISLYGGANVIQLVSRNSNYWDFNITVLYTTESIVLDGRIYFTQSDAQAYLDSFFISFVSGDTWDGLVYKTITSELTGRIWLDRNLGSTQTCTAFDDVDCYGDYYQWGRATDGHEKQDSTTTSTLATTTIPNNDNFILSSVYLSLDKFSTDWTTADSSGSQRTSEWLETDGTSVCPIGFRVPTKIEFEKELIAIANQTDAFNKLKLPSTSSKNDSTGTIYQDNSFSSYWTSESIPSENPNTQNASTSTFTSVGAFMFDVYRARALPIRCIKG